MNDFWPTTLISWVTIVGVPISAMWAILTFHRNNRIKAAEILINIEKEYSRHIRTFLLLENTNDYHRVYRSALVAAMTPGQQLTSAESEAIDRLEEALRHFFVCSSVRRLSVDSGSIDFLCAYYLRLLVGEREDRPELREYVRRYWPSVFFWAPLAMNPWPKRWLIFARQIPERWRRWWTGSWARPDVGAPSPIPSPTHGKESSN